MYDTGIIELQELSPDHWRAKYNGNFGIYTIKITTKDGNAYEWSCTCPSSGNPCKHIGFVMDAIAKRIAQTESGQARPENRAVNILRTLTHEELLEFAIGIIRHNPDLSNQLILEFAHKIEACGNKYADILRETFDNYEFDEELDFYLNDDWPTIDFMDDWINKAEGALESGKLSEAVLIAQACIEELARWLFESGYYDQFARYEEEALIILRKAAERSDNNEEAGENKIDKKELYRYCLDKLPKKEYEKFKDCFYQVMLELAPEADPAGFIEIQEGLLAEVGDKNSWAAQRILKREIDFYKKANKPDAAWDIIRNNLQIKDFFEQWTEHLIEEKRYVEAKKLIHDALLNKAEDERNHHYEKLNKMLLEIALDEKDRPEIRRLAFMFIKDYFHEEYYRVYKAAFSAKEWQDEKERLAANYAKLRDSCNNLADFYHAEGDMTGLLSCVEKAPGLVLTEKYHKALGAIYPEKTLTLFRNAVDKYADEYTGRSHYETITDYLKLIASISGGKKTVNDMIARYRAIYKNRRAMMEILAKDFGTADKPKS